MAFLRLEKVKWSQFFLQKRHFKYKLSVKKQKRGQKTGKKPQKRGVFIGTSALIPETVHTICRFSANDAHHLRNEGKTWSGGLKKTPFFGGVLPVFVLFFASSRTICTWHGYFSKKWDPACLFWPQGPLIQNSATPQGSPPPTQQIKIQRQISWVGRSTSHDHLTSEDQKASKCYW